MYIMRKGGYFFIAGAYALFAGAAAAFAQTDIYIHGSGKLFPIAVPQLCLQEGQGTASREIPETIARNLDLSGYFEVLNPNAYIETPGQCGDQDSLAYADWTIIGAEGLVKGVVRHVGGSLRVQLFLHDVQHRRVVLGKEYEGQPGHARMIAHRFSNEIMKFFTGEMGVFGTQIAFSSRVGRFKELFVMDMDGSNIRQLTRDNGLVISSSWHPAGDRIIYTSYRSRIPNLFEYSMAGRSSRQVTRGNAMELGARYSQDGSVMIASRTVGRDSDIVLFGSDGALLRSLTNANGAIDVSPDWSPDHSKVVFVSNRGGGPQIYVMNADGSGARRVSFVSSSYCTSPAWAPKGDKIAFVCMAEGRNQLFVANSDGTQPLQLTSYGNNEDPAWSPDGRYIVFATTLGQGRTYNLALIRLDGSNLRQLTFSKSGAFDPDWGPMPQ